MTQINRYNKTAVLLHWLIAIAIFSMFALGWYMSDLPKEAPKQMAFDLFDWGIYTWQLPEEISPRSFYFNLHKSLGVTIFTLILLRIIWRIMHRPPTMLNSYKEWERKFATAVHHMLYSLMVLLPLSGIVMATYSKYGINWFGMKLVAGLDNASIRDLFKEAHEVIGMIILVVLFFHIIGALKHKFVDKDDTMKRMSL